MLAVIGSQGLLGRHVTAHFRRVGREIMTFSHRPGADVIIDLHRPVIEFPFHRLRRVSWVLICSAISRIDQCARDVMSSYRINVAHTIELLEGVFRNNIIPIFCSSDLVFDGISGNYSENDPRNPTTEYGKQKKIVEDYLFRQSRPWIILRFSKLYDASAYDESPVGELANRLKRREIVRCADDQMITPTYVQDVVEIIDWCMQTHRHGCYHVAGPQSMTRYELGLTIARTMHVDHLVERCSIDDFGFREPRPRNATLDTRKLRSHYPGKLTFLEDRLSQILEGPDQRRAPAFCDIQLERSNRYAPRGPHVSA